MRRGDDVHRLRPAPAHVDGDAVAAGADVGAGLDQLVEHRVEGAGARVGRGDAAARSEEHTSELQSLMRISYAVFCLKNKNKSKYRQETRNSYKIEETVR